MPNSLNTKEEVERLHSAARRFCIEQHSTWIASYFELEKQNKSRAQNFFKNWEYSDDAYKIFPRYRLLDTALVEIERLVFITASFEEARNFILNAVDVAHSFLAAEFAKKHPVLAALFDQQTAIRVYLTALTPENVRSIAILPYRRVLTKAESVQIWNTLMSKWGIRGPGYYWYPLSPDAIPHGVLTFHEELWNARRGTELLHRFFAERRVSGCLIVHEIDPADYELDIELVDPHYGGSEKFLTSDGSWVLYSSHESSFTLAGPLADYFRSQWNDAEASAYGGPFHTSDLRGTWNA